jgi:hypothetical protein
VTGASNISANPFPVNGFASDHAKGVAREGSDDYRQVMRPWWKAPSLMVVQDIHETVAPVCDHEIVGVQTRVTPCNAQRTKD